MSEKMSRRDFLKVAGIFVGGEAVAGTTLGAAFIAMTDKNSKGSRLVDNATPMPVLDSLNKKRAEMEANGQQNTFVESSGFSNETFSRIVRGTFLLNNGQFTGTGWLAKEEDGFKYIVTCKHNADDWSKIQRLDLCRPGIDKSLFSASSMVVGFYNEDTAVLKVKVDYQASDPLQAMDFKDRTVPQRGSKMMFVGFPGEFLKFDQPYNSYTLASDINVDNGIITTKDGYWVKAIADSAVSGSPVIMNDVGNINVVGMVTGRNDAVFPGDKNPSSALFIKPLNVGSLIGFLKDK